MTIERDDEKWYRHLEGTVLLETAGAERHVMSLALDPRRDDLGLARCITDRKGTPAEEGFVDRSQLRFVERVGDEWNVGEPLEIEGLDRQIDESCPDGMDFLGCEDPDIVEDDEGTLHVFFTMAFMADQWKRAHIALAHASGPDLFSLRAHPPAMSAYSNRGFKEMCPSPVRDDGRRYTLFESMKLGEDGWHSDVGLGITASDWSQHWAFVGDVLVANEMHERYARFKQRDVPDEISYKWCAGHIAPCRLIPETAIGRDDGLLVGVLNARGANHPDGTFDEFRPGLFLFDPSSGLVPWVDPLPLIQDPTAHNIVFSSDLRVENDGSIALYAHIDDTRIVRYDLAIGDITQRLPDSAL